MNGRAGALAVLALTLGCPGAGRGEVVARGAGGFVVREAVVLDADPAVAWSRLVRIQDWWSGEHTYSGDAANLLLSLTPGGCWCERLADGGFVRHMEVAVAIPRRQLTLVGALGPLLAAGASGTLTVTLSPDGPRTRVVAQYAVTGFAEQGVETLAGPVDAVLGEQFRRLAAPPAAPAAH